MKCIISLLLIIFISIENSVCQKINLERVLEFQTLNNESAFKQEIDIKNNNLYFLDFTDPGGLFSEKNWFVKKVPLEDENSIDSIPLPGVDLRSFAEVVDFSVNNQFVVILTKKAVLITERSNDDKPDRSMMTVDVTEVKEGPFRSCDIFGKRIYFQRFTKVQRYHSYGSKVIQYDISQKNFEKLLTRKIQDDAAIQSYKSRDPFLMDINSSGEILFCHPFKGNINIFDAKSSKIIAKKEVFPKSSEGLIDSLRGSYSKYLATSEGKFLRKAWNEYHFKVNAADKCFIEDSLVYVFYNKPLIKRGEQERNEFYKVFSLKKDTLHTLSHRKISEKEDSKGSLNKRNLPILFNTSSYPVKATGKRLGVLYPGHIKKYLGRSYNKGTKSVYNTQTESKKRSLLIYKLK